MSVIRIFLTISVVSSSILFSIGPVAAQPSLPSVDELVKKLAPRASSGAIAVQPVRKRRTRGLVMDEDASDQPESVSSDVPVQPNQAPTASAPAAMSAAAPMQAAVPASPNAGSQQNTAAAASRPMETTVTSPRPAQAAPASNVYSESRITFEFGSDQLTPYAKRVLDVFGAAIQSPQLQNVQFIIEGHTDGVGSDQYNLELSRKRAESVIRYLVDGVRIDPTRLAARGKGRRELVNPNDPGSSDNRRVVWVSQQ